MDPHKRSCHNQPRCWAYGLTGEGHIVIHILDAALLRKRTQYRYRICSRKEEEDPMNQQELEQKFASAGWDLDGGFYNHLIIGYTDILSHILHPSTRTSMP